MKKYSLFVLKFLFINFFLVDIAFSASLQVTNRVPLLSNDKVSVWQTTIYPSKEQTLKMHRHDKDRLLVALTDGKLKITNSLGNIHFLKLIKNKVYFLPKDPPNELHNDQNISNSAPVKVIVIELQNTQ